MNTATGETASLIGKFVSDVRSVHATGSATEHSYRPAFVALFEGLGVTALNEPKRVDCGAPDFMIRFLLNVLRHEIMVTLLKGIALLHDSCQTFP